MTEGPRRTFVAVHTLVARVFIGPPPSPAHQVNHRDGVKAHNCWTNLEWVTPAENVAHASRLGLRDAAGAKPGEAHHNAKLTEEIVTDARAAYARGGVTVKELAARYDVSVGGMQDALKGKTWRHLPGAVRRRVVYVTVTKEE